jgi:hypothetical protein
VAPLNIGLPTRLRRVGHPSKAAGHGYCEERGVGFWVCAGASVDRRSGRGLVAGEARSSARPTAPKLAAWLEENVPEGLAVFTLPKHHRRRLRTSNPIERGVQQELKRRTVKVRVFPNEASPKRLVSAVLVEIDDKWAADTKGYIKWECQDG